MELVDDLDAQSTQSPRFSRLGHFLKPTIPHIVFGLFFIFFFLYLILVVAVPASSYNRLIKEVGSENVYEIPGSMQACHWCFFIMVLISCALGYLWGDLNFCVTLIGLIISLVGVLLIWILYGVYFAKTDLFKLGQNSMSLDDYSKRIDILKASPKAQHKWTGEADVKRTTYYYSNGKRKSRTVTVHYTCVPFIFEASESTDSTKIDLDALFDNSLINIDLQYNFNWNGKLNPEELREVTNKYKEVLKGSAVGSGYPSWKFWNGNTMEKDPGNTLITKTGSLPGSIGTGSRISYAIFWGGLGYCYKLASMVTKKVAYIEKTIVKTESNVNTAYEKYAGNTYTKCSRF